MRIKRLELTGFKSSKDRTVLEFPDGITGIVGPNGCGKSNIVDALRWVLGEQSARHLRGRSMEDVIFVGNQHYGPSGMAEVCIVLDNEAGMPESRGETAEGDEDNEVVRALRKVPELAVTRRLYRSGESEYLINDKPCRLRDITELFLGTGVGTKAYSIVEQGRVGQIIGAKPEELRLFIEEAAGTTLYRSRKIAAERKIERTRDNLLRVSDIVRELDRQANSLRRQARGAVQYQELRTQEDGLDRTWTSLRLRGIDAELRSAAEAAAGQSGREHALRLEIARSQQQRESSRERGRETETARESARQALFAARTRMGETEQERRHLAERRAELEALLGESGNDLGRLDERLANLAGETEEAGRRRDELAERYTAAQKTCAELAERVRACDDQYFSWSSEADSMRSRLIEALGASAALRNERAAVARQIEAADAREARLKSEDEALVTVKDRLQVDLRIADEKLEELAHALESAEGSKRDAAQALEAAQTRRADAQAEAERLRDECALLRSRLESLEELHRGFSGYNDGVRAFMSNGGRERADARAVVADVIEIENGFEGAVAAVLGEALQFIVVPSTQSGIEGARYLREQSAGRATFLPLAGDSANGSGSRDGSLANHVRVREGFEAIVASLLSDCVVVGDLDEARRRWEAGERLTFVTVDGEVVDKRGTVTGGSENPVDEGLLLRSSELRRIRETLDGALTNARVAQDALRATAEAAAGMDGKLAELDRELHHLAVERVRWNGEKRLHDQNAVRTEERMRAVRAELESVQREKAAARARQDESEANLRRKEEEAARLEGERAAFEAAGKSLETERRQALGELEQSRIAEAEARQRIESIASQLSSLAIAKDEAAGRRDALLARLERSRLEVASVAAKLTDPLLDIEKLRAACNEAEEISREIEAEAATAREAVARLDKDIDALQQRLDEARAEYGRCELRRKQFDLERSTLLEGASERLGIGAEELMATEIAEDADPAVLAADLEAVRGKIRRLGTVNLGAVAELEEIEKRLAELCGQRDDLERSIEDLRGTIARLNKLSRQRFQETFEEVNRIFQTTFPKLFHGGKASLALTDPENLLETGVEIFAQPPGKRLGTLDLLSGGEKAMTAIGLIFALFLHRPSPFCVLDEVDAPLDEANIGRFAKIVDEMCERSQFLVITHNKRTMEICDTLYGVTMPEPGVTRMVSVDLSQAA